MVKNPPAMQDMQVRVGERNGNTLQCSCLGNLMNKGAWQATVQGVSRGWTRVINQEQQYFWNKEVVQDNTSLFNRAKFLKTFQVHSNIEKRFYNPTLTSIHDCWKNHSFD